MEGNKPAGDDISRQLDAFDFSKLSRDLGALDFSKFSVDLAAFDFSKFSVDLAALDYSMFSVDLAAFDSSKLSVDLAALDFSKFSVDLAALDFSKFSLDLVASSDFNRFARDLFTSFDFSVALGQAGSSYDVLAESIRNVREGLAGNELSELVDIPKEAAPPIQARDNVVVEDLVRVAIEGIASLGTKLDWSDRKAAAALVLAVVSILFMLAQSCGLL